MAEVMLLFKLFTVVFLQKGRDVDSVNQTDKACVLIISKRCSLFTF